MINSITFTLNSNLLIKNFSLRLKLLFTALHLETKLLKIRFLVFRNRNCAKNRVQISKKNNPIIEGSVSVYCPFKLIGVLRLKELFLSIIEIIFNGITKDKILSSSIKNE
jgi:hypothetical protein